MPWDDETKKDFDEALNEALDRRDERLRKAAEEKAKADLAAKEKEDKDRRKKNPFASFTK